MTGTVVTRTISGWLLLGLLTFSLIFCWLLLRRGYAASLRRTVLVYTGLMTAVPMTGRLWS